MVGARESVGLGVAAGLAVAILTVVPYFFIDNTAVGVYYQGGIGGPPLVALFALIEIIVLVAGAKRRTEPALAAGVAIVIGGFMTVLSWWWAITVSPSLVGGLTDLDIFEYHRWVLATSAAIAAIAAGRFARVVV